MKIVAFIICLISAAQILFAQIPFIKSYYHVLPAYLDSINYKTRLVRYADMPIGVQNYNSHRDVMQVWFLDHYKDLLKTDNEWGLDAAGDLILLQKGTMPYDYEQVEKKPLPIYKFVKSGTNIVINEFNTPAERQKILNVEKAAAEIYQDFATKKNTHITSYINPAKPHIVLQYKATTKDKQDSVVVLNEKQIKEWFIGKSIDDKQFPKRINAKFMGCTPTYANYSLNETAYEPKSFYMTDLYFNNDGEKPYLVRILLYRLDEIPENEILKE
jgi:hypothetical protein